MPSATIEDARKAASDLEIELHVEHVKYSDDVPGAYRRLRSEIDALWMMPDAVVVTNDNFRYLAERTKRDGIAFLAFSENFVRAGALLSVAPDYATMGAQAAAILERMLAQADATPVIQAPIGSSLVVNADTARSLGIDIDANILSFADKVIDGND
jgi:putative ABC transport system substrate-binding protein